MGEGLDIRGGAGGLTANLDDIVHAAQLIETAASVVAEAGGHTLSRLLDADVAEAALLCPVEAATVETSVAGVVAKAAAVTVELETIARLTRACVELYRAVDAELAGMVRDAETAAGFATGEALIPLALAGVAGLVANPLMLAALVADRQELLGDLQASLYDDPWMQEALTRLAPGLVQGTAFSVFGLGVIPLTGGRWPSSDYESSVLGLITLGNRAGMFADRRPVTVSGPFKQPDADMRSSHFLQRLNLQELQLYTHPGEDPHHPQEAQVQILTITQPDGSKAYVVEIPGTESWSPHRGNDPADLTTNLQLMSHARQAQMEKGVADAMDKAGIGPGDPVMLTGHSQGGITAAAMASDPQIRTRFKITSVVTSGSPIGRFKVPSSVSVMSLESNQDVVPRLDGVDNPDLPNWVTVKRDLTSGTPPTGDAAGHNMTAAHSLRNYAITGQQVDASTDASITAWRQENSMFFTDHAEMNVYQLKTHP